jgi:hypothetical protein
LLLAVSETAPARLRFVESQFALLDAFAALPPALRAGAACRDALMRSSIFEAIDFDHTRPSGCSG